MSFRHEIPSEELATWLAELKRYQRSALEELLKHMSPEEAAMRWVTSQGSANIAGFGGAADGKPFWDRFKLEFRKFLCDDSEYIEDKKALDKHSTVSKTLLISSISASLGASIGQTATLIAPAVTIMLFLVGKMGRNAFCASGHPDKNASG